MRIEDEIEWNSHIIKSGRVFGTYDWMISKGYNLEEINYVVFDTIDDTWEPLAKAVGKATQQHPDILLKNAMRDAVQQDQATQFQQRMQAGRDAGLNPKPTGAEYMQANKPFSAMYAGFKNIMSGGAHSRGDVEPEATEGQQERFGLMSALRRPGVALGSALRASSAKSNYGRLSEKIAQNEFAMDRLLAGRKPDDLSPSELERYKDMQRIVENAAEKRDKIDTSSYQERAKKQANARFAQKRPNAAPGDAPFPRAASQALQNPEQAQPLDDGDEEVSPEAKAAVEEVNANEEARQANAEMPTDQDVVNPQASEASDEFNFREAMAGLENPYSAERIRGLNKDYDAMMERTGGNPTYADIKEMFKGRRGAAKKDAEQFLLDKFNLTPEEAEKIAEKLVEEAPAEEAPAEEAPAEPAEPADDDDIEDFDDDDIEGFADEDEDEIEGFDDDDEKKDDVITSSDTLESLNMAWTFLKHRV